MSTITPRTPRTPAPKDRARAIWAAGDYTRVADELIPSLGPALLDALGDVAGERLLDVAAGDGNVAIPAALRGARVTASDLVPQLLDAGRARADVAGADLDWVEADAEALPFADGSFDVVTSCVGVMFTPDHQLAADELVRVTRTGGRLGVLNWTPTSFVGRLFTTMSHHLPPAPAGTLPPAAWGDLDHVTELWGDRVDIVTATPGTLVTDKFPRRGDFRRFFAAYYGPTVMAFAALAEDEAATRALSEAIDDLAEEFTHPDGMHWDYLIVTGRRREQS